MAISFTSVLQQRRNNMDVRVGFGYDVHRFAKVGKPFLLAGVVIDGKEVVAHSDGDVLLHSLSNAVLSSIGLDDIGNYFPDNSQSTADIDSKDILLYSLSKLNENGYLLSNIVIDIHLERPKLKDYKEKIKEAVSLLTGLDEGRIAIHANTGEKLGPVGNEECVIVYSQVCVIKN